MLSIDTFIISLKNRLDRRAQVESQLNAIELNRDLVRFQEARFTPRNGAIGCALSHAYALSRFMFESNSEYCLIFEDDFEILNPDTFNQTVSDVLTKFDGWDVLMLASNVAVPTAGAVYPNVYRVIHAQTASAYLVKRAYAPTLIKTFYEASEYMSSNYLRLETKSLNYFYAIDMLWKPLQFDGKYYAFLPQLVRQRESFSDIENKHVAYGV